MNESQKSGCSSDAHQPESSSASSASGSAVVTHEELQQAIERVGRQRTATLLVVTFLAGCVFSALVVGGMWILNSSRDAPPGANVDRQPPGQAPPAPLAERQLEYPPDDVMPLQDQLQRQMQDLPNLQDLHGSLEETRRYLKGIRERSREYMARPPASRFRTPPTNRKPDKNTPDSKDKQTPDHKQSNDKQPDGKTEKPAKNPPRQNHEPASGAKPRKLAPELDPV